MLSSEQVHELGYHTETVNGCPLCPKFACGCTKGFCDKCDSCHESNCGGDLVVVQIQDLHSKAAPRLSVVCSRSMVAISQCGNQKPSRRVVTRRVVLGGTPHKRTPSEGL